MNVAVLFFVWFGFFLKALTRLVWAQNRMCRLYEYVLAFMVSQHKTHLEMVEHDFPSPCCGGGGACRIDLESLRYSSIAYMCVKECVGDGDDMATIW